MGRWNLSRIPGFRHASDDALVFLSLVGPEASPERLVAHVAHCEHCASRLAAIDRRLADDRARLVANDDQAFAPVRLERQRGQILKRIGGSRAAARILPFPAHGPMVPAAPHRSAVRRSVAAAAVAGLVIGGAAGRLFDPHPARDVAMSRPQVVALDRTPSVRPASAVSEELFLGEFEAAVGASRVEPLMALDALTPSPADVVLIR